MKVSASNESGLPDLMVASSGEDSSWQVVGKFKKVCQNHCKVVVKTWVECVVDSLRTENRQQNQ